MRWIWGVILILTQVFVFFSLARAQELSGNLDLTYTTNQTSTDGSSSNLYQFTQNYYLNYTSKLTPAIGINSTLHYTKTDSKDRTSRIIYPSLGLNLNNEYVTGNLSFDWMDSDTNKSPRITNYFINLNLITQMEKWPQMNFQCTHSRQYDHQQTKGTDNASDTVIGGIIYDYGMGQVLYNFMGSFSQDYVQNSTQDGYNHIARINFHKSLFNNRLSLYSDCGYNYYTVTTKASQGSTLDVQRRAVHGFYGVDSTPEQTTAGTLTVNDQLIDKNKDVTVVSVSDNLNIGVELETSQAVDTIYVYTDRNFFYTNEAIVWEVYYTNEDTEPRNWTKITSAASFSYNSVEHRFEISFNSTQARYFKVVYRAPITNPPSFGITEIEVYGQESIEGQMQTHTKNYTANAGISFRPLEKWTTDYHITYYKTDSFTNSYPTGMNYNFNQGVSLSGELASDLLLTLSYQTSKNRSNQETTSQLYSLNLQYLPLETLTTALTLTHSATKENGEKTADNNGIVLSAVAEVWEGINVNWDLNINFNEAPQTGTKTNSVFSSLYIRTILTKHLNWDIDYDWQWQSTKDNVTKSTSSSSINTTVVYTPSSKVYGRLYVQYNNRSGGSYFSHQYSLGCFLTQKIQMNATSQFTNISDGTSQMMHSLDLIFNLGRRSSFRTGYSYSQTKKGEKQTSHDFYMRFSIGF